MPDLKKLIRASIIGALFLSSYAPFNAATAVSNNTLIVGTEPTIAPFDFVDRKTQKIVGFDIDIINAIAKAEGYNTQFVNMPFAETIAVGRLDEDVDVAINGISITEERKNQFGLSEPYFDAGLSILIAKKFENEIMSDKDLQDKVICAKKGTVGYSYALNLNASKVEQYNSDKDTYLALANGHCAAVINDNPVHEFYLLKSKATHALLLRELLTHDEYGIVYEKGDEAVAKIISSGLSKIKADGTYEKIYKKWFEYGSN